MLYLGCGLLPQDVHEHHEGFLHSAERPGQRVFPVSNETPSYCREALTKITKVFCI